MVTMATVSSEWGHGSNWPIVSKLHFSEWFPQSCYWNRAPSPLMDTSRHSQLEDSYWGVRMLKRNTRMGDVGGSHEGQGQLYSANKQGDTVITNNNGSLSSTLPALHQFVLVERSSEHTQLISSAALSSASTVQPFGWTKAHWIPPSNSTTAHEKKKKRGKENTNQCDVLLVNVAKKVTKTNPLQIELSLLGLTLGGQCASTLKNERKK